MVASLTRAFDKKIPHRRFYGAGITLTPVVERSDDEQCKSDGGDEGEADERVKQREAGAG
jgi:hypothetical protein